ncbi:MAG TPA: rhomboid family intramembrane serine protease [Thermodesulfobacteriota bacterium]|nr:rhomboid family intramembrane serine protease [Thermodesulfobacteriota bacterium]
MIPLRDKNPSGKFPLITVLLIVINVLVFIYQLSLRENLTPFFHRYALIPAQIVFFGESPGISLRSIFFPFFTSMFLHGGWFHVIGNMWYLWIFGDNIEDRLGHVRFFIFYLVCGIGAAVAHVILNPNSTVPCVGASGAIAGVLGAYLISFPFARVATLVPIFFYLTVIEIPAVILLVFWFVLQFFSGTLSIAATAQTGSGGVAWWAHVGGFIIGMILISLIPKRKGFQRRGSYFFKDRGF